MPNTLDLIAKRGMTFNRYYVSYPLCCPSRVSLLTGRYAHNHGVKGNIQPDGGYTGFAQRAAYTHNLAVWLQNSGYRTIHVGKFLNGYGDDPYDDGKTVPPGWSAWHTVLNADTDHYYYGYTENNNGTIEGPYGDSGSWETREYGARDDIGCPFAPTNGLPCYYETDHFTQQATEEISQTPPGQPFYLQLDYTAPHGDFRRPAGPEPAPRHYDWFKGARLPHDRQEGFDEGNVTDKPRFIREAEHLTLNDKHTYRVYWQKQLESLRSVDDGVKEIIDTLGGLSRLRNTYILFTSDNGFFFGEHRLLGGKFLAYEPATHLPFLIRGPGIKPGTSTGELTANIDIAPTILELAGATADKSIDGRSMVPFLHDPSLRTRRPLLFESFVETSDVEQQGGAETQPGYEPAADSGGALARPSRQRRRRHRLDPRSAQGLRGNPPRPLQVHRLAVGGEGALQHQQGPQRAQQPGQDPQLLPGPQLPPHAADGRGRRRRRARGLRRPHLPGTGGENPAQPDRTAPRPQAGKGRKNPGTAEKNGNSGNRNARKKNRNRKKKGKKGTSPGLGTGGRSPI